MKNICTAILVISLLSWNKEVSAQNTLNNLGLTAATPSAGAYSVRRLATSYTGPVMRLRRSSDGELRDVYFDGTGIISLASQVSNAGGGAATGTTLATWITTNSATVNIWYDQSGNGRNATQATTAQPRIVNAGVLDSQNSQPTLVFSGAQTMQTTLTGVLATTTGNQTTANFVFQNAIVQSSILSNGDGGGNRYNIHAPWNDGNTYFDIGNNGASGRIQTGLTWGAYAIGTFRKSGAQGDIWKNGANLLSSGSFSSNVTSAANLWIGSFDGSNFFVSGGIAEVIVFPSALSTANRNTLECNQGVFYQISFIPSPTISGGTTTFCQGQSLTINYTVCSNFPNTPANNVFTAQLSDAAGSFATPTNIGTVTSNTSGSITANLGSASAGTGYRIRIVSSNPGAGVVSADNGTNLVISDYGINAPTFAGTTFCPNQTFNVNYTLLNSCAFPNTPSNNIFTAQLSNSVGSFATPTDIGSASASGAGAISVTIPVGTTPGNGYRIRVISSNPAGGRISSDNGSNLTINAIGLNAPTGIAATYCANATFNITNVLSTSCNFVTGNTFTAQLSDASGSFASPTNISLAVSATAGGTISITLPATATTSSNYRIQVVSTSPVRTSVASGTFAINALAITAPTVTGGTTTFCQGQNLTINYTVNCTFPTGNIFTAQLSDAAGSFASPVPIGTVTSTGSGSISANIGSSVAGTGYRIRVISSNPVGVTSPANGTNLTINASAGNPTVFGSGAWNAYAYSGTALSSNPSTISSNIYLGTYIENNLSFNTQNRWGNTAGPTAADASQGAGNAYQGCPQPGTVGQQYSVSLKRTNIPCGYYQIDIPGHDDDVRLFINGTQVFAHAPGCCDAHTNVWTGFINPAATVEFQFLNGGGPGYLQVTIGAAPNPLNITPSIVQCSAPTTPATLSVSSPVALTYAWTPTTGLTPPTGFGASVVAAPGSTTTYTATGTDAVSGCTVTATTTVTVSNATPVILTTNSVPTICSGVNTSTLTASGASNYTWSPSLGLSATTGPTVTANPAATTTYTVTGNNGCTGASNTATANVTVNVQTVPTTPPTTGAASFGNNTWNAFCHFNNTTYSNLYGYYTENNLSFNTTSRWANNAGPSVANASSGLAYNGCAFTAPAISTNYSMSFKRTNFTCNYYQINVDFQDDQFTLLIDGVQVFQNNGYTPTLQSNVWTGFLGPSSQVELRLINNGGAGQLQVTFTPSINRPQSINTDITICAGTNAALSATSSLAGATYSWSFSPSDPSLSFAPNANLANPFIQTSTSPAPSFTTYTVTNTLTDATGTGCTATRSFTLTVDPLPNTSVTPTSATVSCSTATTTLTASGAASYTWSPTAGLSATTGFSVIANPTVTTTYTVTGSNNCAVVGANTTITVIPLPAITTFPSGTWNVYGFNSQTIGTNYQGYYTENGSGATGLNFDTRTRWTSGGAPSTANATNGIAWQGCVMNTSNISISAKRTGFACGVYQIDIPAHDDDFYLLINGVQVARHNGCCDTHTNVWTGVLNSNSTVEFQMQQGGGGSYLQVAFTLVTQPVGTTVWLGGTSNDWFTASNWCGGIPTTTLDALIPAAGPQNMPVINNTGAVARNITVNAAVPASGGTVVTPLIPAASLTTNSFNLDVNGNWTNNGTYTANSGSISFVGTGSGNTISTNGTNTFNNVVINKTNGITISSGTSQIVGTMTFTSGIVTQSATLQFLNGSTVASASNTSYVNGIVTKIGTNAFTFPVGASNLYRPIGISASAGSNTFTAQYINANPNPTYPNAQRAVTLDHVSGAEYWLLNRTVGSSNVNVTLSWGSNSGGVGNLSSLRVAAWNGSLWSDQGNTGTTGTTIAGNVTSSVSTVYGPFTLGTIDNSNPLPVELIYFNCALTSTGNVELKWATASEINSDYFDVERSVDGRAFESIGTVKSAGTTNEKRTYSFQDKTAPGGFVYYQLKQVDFDGTPEYFKVCTIEVPTDNTETKLYPNPASGFTTINLNGKSLNSLSVTNNMGQGVSISYMIEPTKIVVNTSTLASGVYIVSVILDQEPSKLKLIIQR